MDKYALPLPGRKERRRTFHETTFREKRLGAVLLSLALCLSLLPMSALAAEGDVNYLYYENGEWKTGTKYAGEYTVLASPARLEEGWYVVKDSVQSFPEERIVTTGDVHLILADGCSFNTWRGIQVADGHSLTIYAQSTGDQMGRLTANGYGISADNAINNITIHGGMVTVSSGRGIGGASSVGSITINGGVVSATNDSGGAGIGSGERYYAQGTINIAISGGTVTAQGGAYGAGIGDGIHDSVKEYTYNTSFSTGSTGEDGSAVIFATRGDAEEDVDISDDSDKNDWSGVIFEGTTGTVYGSPTPTEDFTIPAGYTLTIPQGTTLTIPQGVTLTNQGTITGGGTLDNKGTILLDGGTMPVDVTGDVRYSTSVSVSASPSPATFEGDVTLTATVTMPSGEGVTLPTELGTVSFSLGENSLGDAVNVTNSDGVYTATLSDVQISAETGFQEGSNTITAAYSGVAGDGDGYGLAESSNTVTLTVSKAEQTTAPDAPSGASIVTATSITLDAVTGGSGEGAVQYGYTTGAEAEPGHWQTGTEFTGLTAATAYTFYTRYAGNENYEPSPASNGTEIYTAYAAPKEDEGYTIDYATETVTANSGYEVRLNENDNWTASGTALSITPGGTFQVRHAADTDGAPASDETTVNVAARPDAPTLTIDNEKEGVVISAEYYYNTTAGEYNAEGWTPGAGSLVTVQPGSSIYIYKAATDSAFKSDVQPLTAPARASAPTVPTINYEDEALTGATAGMEYSTDSKPWTACNADDMAVTAFGWDGTKEVSVQFRTAATGSNYASEAVSLNIPARPAAPAVTGGVERIQGATTDMEYRTGDGAWTQFTQATVGRLDPGTYAVRLAATDSAFASAPVTVTVTQYTPPANPNYRVDLPTPENGTITADPAAAKAGETVTLTPAPEEGYEVGEIIVTDRFGDAVAVTENPDGTYTFTMPSGQVRVEVTFVEATPEPLPFTDVKEDDWFHDAVRYVYDNGLMDGVGDGQFAPNATTNRAMVVTILYRLAGEPAVSGDTAFTDVAAGLWYTDAVLWAAQKGIVNGVSETEFSPSGDLTREQLATILYRYAESMGYDVSAQADLSGFPDAGDIQSYATQALSWAVAEGLLQGFEDDSLQPAGTATRAQIATILMRFCETVAQ